MTQGEAPETAASQTVTAAEPQATSSCGNCGAPLAGHFCSACGQRDAGRLTFRRIASEAADHVLSLDSALLRTAIDLSRNPGRVARDYVRGRRKAYLNPLKYTFVMATLFALVINLLDVLPAGVPTDNEKAVQTYKLIVSLLGYLAYFYMLPVAALQSRLFRRQGDGVAECYVPLLYFYGHFLLLGSLLTAFGIYSTAYGTLAMRGLGLFYFLWLLVGFYRGAGASAYLKSFVLYLAFNVVNMGSGALIMFLTRLSP
ncbi:MAG: DUF3667 domain-containing protein [Acidobacteriota bacterium]